MKGCIMSTAEFRLRHFGHKIVTASSSDGPSLICERCDIANTTPEQEAGSRRNIPDIKDWIKFHEKHGEVGNSGGGMVADLSCTCGSSY